MKFVEGIKSCSVGTAAFVAAIAFCTSVKASEDYPNKPIKVIVPAAAGGGLDVTTRLVVQKMGEILGQPMVVDNKPGADSLVGSRFAKAASADGYTLLAAANTLVVQPLVKMEPGYRLEDFVGIGPMAKAPFLALVAAGQPDKTLKDFIARAKEAPQQMTYASSGVGAATHMAAAMFLQRANLRLMHVPYKGNGAAMPDVLSGRIDLIFGDYLSGAGNIKGGALRPLAVTSKSRLAVLPSVPTIAESGYPDFEYSYWAGLFAPAGTSKAVVDRLSQALNKALSAKEVQERFRSEGSEVMKMSPDDFHVFLKSEVSSMTNLVKELKLQKQ